MAEEFSVCHDMLAISRLLESREHVLIGILGRVVNLLIPCQLIRRKLHDISDGIEPGKVSEAIRNCSE